MLGISAGTTTMFSCMPCDLRYKHGDENASVRGAVWLGQGRGAAQHSLAVLFWSSLAREDAVRPSILISFCSVQDLNKKHMKASLETQNLTKQLMLEQQELKADQELLQKMR